MNEIEFVPTEDIMLVAVHQSSGVTVIHEMSREDFERLQAACAGDN